MTRYSQARVDAYFRDGMRWGFALSAAVAGLVLVHVMFIGGQARAGERGVTRIHPAAQSTQSPPPERDDGGHKLGDFLLGLAGGSVPAAVTGATWYSDRRRRRQEASLNFAAQQTMELVGALLEFSYEYAMLVRDPSADASKMFRAGTSLELLALASRSDSEKILDLRQRAVDLFIHNDPHLQEKARDILNRISDVIPDLRREAEQLAQQGAQFPPKAA